MTGYHYEQSDPERFQELCQSLVLDEYPDLVCFPVGQKDGGRDGWSEGASSGRTVLQVKFKRHDEPTDDVAEWMIKALELELPKVRKLVDLGAERYLMLTNARGTAPLGGGSIDRVNSWLADNYPVSASCRWRDDIDRRLHKMPALRWKFPEILSGTDGIQLALETMLKDDVERRQRAIRAFVNFQLSRDAEVKFKQIELRNDLIDLFVDVPAVLSGLTEKRFRSADMASYRAALHRLLDGSGDHLYSQAFFDSRVMSEHAREGIGVGTASLLLDIDFQADFQRIVIEGAPGQGKSTLAQYVCQVHRARYAGRSEIVDQLPESHRSAPLRLPFKVDLRDLAVWLDGRDPFDSEQAHAVAAGSRSIEAFLANAVQHCSGGISFDSNDVSAVLEQVPSLLFLDGLDEVADIKIRAQLIKAVRDGIHRLEGAGADLQVVVTTRPAAFANSPGFSKRDFTHLELLNIPQDMAFEYAQKWIRVRSLDEQDASDVRSILTEKLDAPHIRDLARNPMQLAILLTLIHSEGYSLPDERTDLYASYLEKFLTREAAKSSTVRDYRALLVKLHEYLAWVLQARSETSDGTAGSLTSDELRSFVGKYLHEHQYPDGILDTLFTGILERVWVLVQRIEGRYEFEVQPIREYFCAKHLYESASSYGEPRKEPRGTRSDRFDALARNPYWTNVIRFYAGCYSSGEVGGLYFQLEELREDAEFAFTARPRHLGSMLLGDWVFKTNPRATARVAEVAFDSLGLKLAAHGFGSSRAGDPTSLPEGAGRKELGLLAVEAMDEHGPFSSNKALSALAAANSTPEVRAKLLTHVMGSAGASRSRWIRAAGAAGVFDAVDIDWVATLAGDGCDASVVGARAVDVGRASPTAISTSAFVSEAFLAHCMRGAGSDQSKALRFTLNSWADLFAELTSMNPLLSQVLGRGGVGLTSVLSEGSASAQAAGLSSIAGFLSELEEYAKGRDRGLQTDWPAWWDHFTTISLKNFGRSWSTYHQAAAAAGIPSKDRLGRGASVMFGKERSLYDRARHARLKRGGRDWWIDQLQSASDHTDEMWWVLLLLSWQSQE